MAESDSDNMRCLGCDYRLQGLPDSVCPECGRAFDREDGRTFAVVSSVERRRRRVRVAAVVVGLFVLLAAFAPRGLCVPQLTLICRECGVEESTTRVELLPPKWIPFRYPGINWPIGGNDAAHAGCGEFRYDLKFAHDARTGVRGGGASATGSSGSPCYVNEFLADRGNEVEIVESAIQRRGVSVTCGPPPSGSESVAERP